MRCLNDARPCPVAARQLGGRSAIRHATMLGFHDGYLVAVLGIACAFLIHDEDAAASIVNMDSTGRRGEASSYRPRSSTSGLTMWAGRSLHSTASRLRAATSAIRSRVATVAEAMCGTTSALGSATSG